MLKIQKWLIFFCVILNVFYMGLLLKVNNDSTNIIEESIMLGVDILKKEQVISLKNDQSHGISQKVVEELDKVSKIPGELSNIFKNSIKKMLILNCIFIGIFIIIEFKNEKS